jgi:hypothetical protein
MKGQVLMQSVDQRIRTLNAMYHKDNNLAYFPATVVVRATVGVSSIYDPAIPGNVWVSGQSSNGLSLPPSVRPPQQQGIDLAPGRKVRLEYDVQGELYIAGIDTRGALSSGQPAVPLPPVQAAQTAIQTLAVTPTSPPSLSLAIKAWNPVKGNRFSRFTGIAPTAAVVPSAGQMYYAIWFIKDDLSAEVTYSTARGMTDVPLNDDDINEALALKSIGSTPVHAQKLVGGQTAISQADIDADGVPLQQLVNTDDGEYIAVASTINATVTTLWTLTIPASTTVMIEAKVVARRTGGSSGSAEDGAVYIRSAAIKNVGGTATLIGSVAALATMEDQAGWDCTIDVAGATARVRITGAVNNAVSWRGTFTINRVSS